MVRYKQDHRDRTQAAIIDAASEMLRERGFTETSVGNVMKAVGLTHGGFYAHFADKTAMLAAAMSEAFVESPKNFAFLADLANRQGDVGLIARHYLAESRVDAVASGCPAAALVSEVHRQDGSVRDAFHDGAERTMQALAGAPGLARDGAGLSWAALSMLVGSLSMMRAIPDPAVRDAIRDQAMAAMRKLAAVADAAPHPADPAS
jgi:TetR/AcrR family transcriptional regulator, transcriptional repressor for nem operon